MTDLFATIESAAHTGAHGLNGYAMPTAAQHAAGNYRVGRVTYKGLPLSIEQPRHSIREGVSRDGKPWRNRMAAHYGYIRGTRGADGDGVDVFIGPVPETERVFVINQVDPLSGDFDEHKVMLAFQDAASAKQAYLESYDRGWKGLGTLIPCTLTQLRWWLKHGDLTKPLAATALPYDGNATMTDIAWDSAANPIGTDLSLLIYGLRRDDAEGLALDAVTVTDILQDSDGELALDALVVPVAKLERKMSQLQAVMQAAASKVSVVAMQVTPPFKQRGTTNVAAVFELSDGQTVSIFFHNPDSTPNKLAPTDEMTSWKWLLNKKDVTIVVAPEKGQDLNVREVARRIMKLAEKNSARFQQANQDRAQRLAAIEEMKKGVEAKTAELAGLNATIADLTAKVKAKNTAAEPAQQDDSELIAIAVEAAKRGAGGITRTATSKYFTFNVDGDEVVLTDELRAKVESALGVKLVEKVFPGFELEVALVGESALEKPIVVLTGKEMGEFKDNAEGSAALRKAAASYLDGLIGQWVDCPALGEKVEIRKSGAKKVISLSADVRKLKLLPALKALLARSTVQADDPTRKTYLTEKELNIVAYHYLHSEAMLNGEQIGVRFVIKEDDKGKFHWDHSIKKNALSVSPGAYSGNPESGTSGLQQGAMDSVGDDEEVLNLFIDGEQVESPSNDAQQIAKVDAVYSFDASDDFKTWLAESLEKDSYSPFVTARDMDKAVKAHGAASVTWAFSGAQPADGMQSLDGDKWVGEIRKYGALVGRIDMGGDGKAMVYVGASKERVKDAAGRDFYYSDDDAVLMVDELFRMVTGERQPKGQDAAVFDPTSPQKAPAGPDASAELLNKLAAGYGYPGGVDTMPDGLGKAARKLYGAIIAQDVEAAMDVLHLDNKRSRKAFESLIGAMLPKTIKGTREAVADFFGRVTSAMSEQSDAKAPTSIEEALAMGADEVVKSGIAINPALSPAERDELRTTTPYGYLQGNGVKYPLYSEAEFDRAIAANADNDIQLLYRRFNPEEVRMPTAVQLGAKKISANGSSVIRLITENGVPYSGWTNGHILDLGSLPKFIKKVTDEVFASGLNIVLAEKALALVDRAKANAIKVEPIAAYESSHVEMVKVRGSGLDMSKDKDREVTVNGVVLVNEDAGLAVTLDKHYYAYFAKAYKGAEFYASNSAGDAVLVKHNGQAVGLAMPINMKDAKVLQRAVKATGQPLANAPAPQPSTAEKIVVPSAPQATPPQDGPEVTEAKRVLQAVIDGTVDLMELNLADQLVKIHDDFTDDTKVMDLFEKAAKAYSDFMVVEARKALA